jgi:hypothetical protein
VIASDDIRLCRRRVLKYERLIKELKAAWDASEMTNYHVALQKLFRALQEV